MPTISLSDADNHQSFDVETGNEILIRVEESPATGYRWTLDQLDQTVITLQGTDFSSVSAGVGGGGERVLTFKAQRPGTTQLALKLWRDWEGDNSVVKRFEITINVR